MPTDPEPAFADGPLACEAERVNRDRLFAALVEFDLPENTVSFDGPGIGECYVLEHGSRGWSVYYSERGLRQQEQVFVTERVALRYLLGWIFDDCSVLGR